jgi:ketosteroid isomerase-like protein
LARALVLVIAFGGMLAAPVAAQQPTGIAPLPTVALPPALDRVLRDYERAWGARDAEALAGLFTDDGFVLRPGDAPIRGRSAVEEAYRGAGGPLALRALGYAAADSVAYIVGAFARDRTEPDIGKFVLALRLGEAGRWLIAADMDNAIGRR